MVHNQVDASRIQDMDSGEKRLNELGYKQELRREMVGNFFIWFHVMFYYHINLSFVDWILHFLQTLFKTLAISFSTMTLFTGITPLYGSSLAYAGPASLVWGWLVVSFFTWFVGIAMAEICSSFPVCHFSLLIPFLYIVEYVFAYPTFTLNILPWRWRFLSSHSVLQILTVVHYRISMFNMTKMNY